MSKLFIKNVDKYILGIYFVYTNTYYCCVYMANFEHLAQQIQERKFLRDQKIEKLMASLDELDGVVNFRVSSSLKEEFNKVCKENQSTISRELKRYMLTVVKQGRF